MAPASVLGSLRLRRALIGSGVAMVLIGAIVGGLAATTGIGDLEIFAPERGTVAERLSTVEDFLAENSEAVKTELSRMQGEIEALTTATPSPGTPSTPANDLATTTHANAWVSVVSGSDGEPELQVLISSTSVAVAFEDLRVELFAGQRNLGELCNSDKVFGGEWSSYFGTYFCSVEHAPHADVTHANMSVTTSVERTELRCERNSVYSTSTETILACAVRWWEWLPLIR